MWTDNDRNMSRFFMEAYSNFAKYGYVYSNTVSIYLHDIYKQFK